MKLKNLRFCLTLILLTASLIPIVAAPNIQPEPIDSNDDAFITGVGNYFGDTPYLFLRDEVTNLVLGVRFRNVNIAQGEKINNATLFVRSVYTYAAAGDIRVTITGDDIDDSRAFNDSGSFSRTYTGAYVVWNISEVNGDSWHNVSVTEIVQEIIDRVGWQSGNDLSLVFFTDKGIPRREFASVDGNPAFTPYIDINYGIAPPQDEVADLQNNSTAPYNDTVEWTWTYNDTYRGIDIYIVTQNSLWLNFSTFTQFGADDRMTGENETFFQLTNFYQDSDDYYRRNFSDDGSGLVGVKFGITWEGLPWQGPAVNGYAGLYGISDIFARGEAWTNGYRYTARVRTAEVTGNIRTQPLDSTSWMSTKLESGLPFTLWYDIRIDMNAKLVNTSVYNDPEMTSLNESLSSTMGAGPDYTEGLFQYEYIFFRNYDASALNTGVTAKFHSIIETDLDSVIFLVYPNGTLVDDDPLPDDVSAKEAIDDLLGGAQPEDPEPEDYTIIDKFRWKLLVLCVGMIMMVGSPLAGVIYGADTATWIKLLFVAFFGLGILWQIKFM